MELLLGALEIIFGCFGAISCCAGIVFGLMLLGYFLIRVLLKILGVYSAPPDRIRLEMKVAGVCGFLFAFTIGCFLLMDLVGYLAGPPY